jgi:hypothetical protein
MCNGQTDNETRLLPIGRENGSGNLILCRECYGVELNFRLNRIIEGVEQDMPTWDSLEVVASGNIAAAPSAINRLVAQAKAVDPTEAYRRNNPKPKGKL